MSSQLSSTTNIKKWRKLVDSDADEVLVLQKKQEVTATKTVSISIPNLLKKINDETETLTIACGRDFQIRNKKVFISVISRSYDPGYIKINIANLSKEDVVLSLDWKETPFILPPPDFFHKKMRSHSVIRLPAMSYDDYKQWAMEHGDVFELKVTITLHLKESSNQWTNLRSKSLAAPDPPGAVEKMGLEEGVFSDFTILSEEDRRFPCHRIILAAKSSTLKAMLTIEMKEKDEKEYKLHHSNQVVEAFVSYFYKGEVPSEVLEANLPSFLELSDFYDLEPMKAQVEKAAINGLTMENVVEMFSLANLHNARALKDATSFFILENKKKLGQQDLSQVPASVMTELFKLLSQF